MQKQAGFVGSSRRPSRARCPPCGCWVLLDLLQLALLAAGGVDTHLANDGRTVVEIQPPAGHVFTFGEDLDMMLIVQNLDQRRAEGAIFAFQVIEEQTKARVGGLSGLLDGFQAGSDSFNVPMKFDSQLQPGRYGLKTQILVGAHEVASLPWHPFRIQRAGEEPY